MNFIKIRWLDVKWTAMVLIILLFASTGCYEMLTTNDEMKESPSLIEGAIKVNQMTAPLNPYAGLIDVVLKIIAGTGTAGVVGLGVKTLKDNKTKKNLAKENDVVKKKYTAEKRGLEKIRIAHPESYDESFKYIGTIRKELGVG